ncbi:MAG: 50S ribosomal protein L25 [bacterium]
MTQLQVSLRTAEESAEALRSAGKIPAVIYGAGVKETISVSVNREDFKKAWGAAGSSTSVTLSGANGDHDCIIHDFQIDPRTDQVIHADFLALDKNTKVTVSVELEFIGESQAVKDGFGILEKALHEIEVEALPANLPKSIPVSVHLLETADSQIHIKDLQLPAGVTIKGHDPEDVVALVAEIKEESEEPAGPIDFASIEVEKKGKKEEEESAE